MASVVVDRPAPRLASHARERAYIALTRRLAAAAARDDELTVRRLIGRRERLLARLRAQGAPSRAVASEVRALEAQTMLSLGVGPAPASDRVSARTPAS